MSKTATLVTTDKEKAEVPNNIFTSVVTGNLSTHTSLVDGPQDRDWMSKIPSTIRQGQFHDWGSEQPDLVEDVPDLCRGDGLGDI